MPLTFKLKGWKQIISGLLLLLIIPVLYTKYLHRSLDTQLPRLIDARLRLDLGNDIVRRTIPPDQESSSITRKQGEYLEKDFKALDGLKIVSTEKRGWGASVTVKVVFTLERSPMVQSEETRYYRLKHTWIGGWFVRGPATQASYKLGWLF